MPTKKLPVIATAVEAMKLPLINWRDFIKFACVPIAGFALLQFLFVWNNGPQKHPSLLVPIVLALYLSMIPLQIAWIRLAVNGPDSVSERDIWSFGRVELRYLAGGIILALIPEVPAFVTMVLAMMVMTRVIFAMPLILLSFGLFVAGVGCSIRLSFILVELALDRYKDWRNSWNRTRGIISRLIALPILAMLPFTIASSICGAIQAEVASHMGWMAVTLLAESAVTCLTTIAVTGALALAYKFTAPEPETAAAATS